MSFRSYVIIPLVLLSAKPYGGTLNPSVDVLLNQLYICTGADFYLIPLSLFGNVWKSNSCGIALLQKEYPSSVSNESQQILENFELEY
jgi:hypothetical protein